MIERMHAMQAEGMSYDRIAGQLNLEGVKPRAGERWWGKTVNNILGQTSPKVAPVRSTADWMLEAMRTIEPQWSVPVSIRELRAALPSVAHAEFDRAALALRNEQKVFLSQHDYPQAEREEVRRQLVRDGDRYFVAITARDPS